MTIVQEIEQMEGQTKSFGLELEVAPKFRFFTIKRQGIQMVTGNFFKVRDWLDGFIEGRKP